MSTKENYFHALSNLCLEMGATRKQNKILDLIVSTAVKTLEGKAAVIFLADEDSDSFIHSTPAAQVGLSERYIHAGPAHAVKISPQLLEEGHLYFRDAKTDERLANREAKKAEGIGSILTVPVIDQGKLLGILSLYTQDIRKFDQDEIAFLSILAKQGGQAIATAHLLRKIRNYIDTFLKLAASISESLEVKTILQTLTQDLVGALQIKAVSVSLLDEDKRTVKRVASFGLSDRYLNKGPILADKNMAEALKGKTIPIKDIATDPGIQYKQEKKKEGIVSMLYVPIKAKDEIIGVLVAYSQKSREFTEDEIRLLTALAYQGGLAINNACLYLMMQDDIRDLKENIWSHKCWF